MMNKSMLRTMLFGLVVALASLPLHAQSSGDEKDETVAKIQTNGGVIMISEEGEQFQTALPDQRVKAKARLMVSEESSATVVYDDGCDQKYEKPGVYEISGTCVLPFLASGGSAKGWIVAGVIGAAILVYTLDDDDDDRRPPVSR